MTVLRVFDALTLLHAVAEVGRTQAFVHSNVRFDAISKRNCHFEVGGMHVQRQRLLAKLTLPQKQLREGGGRYCVKTQSHYFLLRKQQHNLFKWTYSDTEDGLGEDSRRQYLIHRAAIRLQQRVVKQKVENHWHYFARRKVVVGQAGRQFGLFAFLLKKL